MDTKLIIVLSLAAVVLIFGGKDTLIPILQGSAPSSNACIGADVHWKSAESIGTVEAFEDHLARFGNCAFASFAIKRINAIRSVPDVNASAFSTGAPSRVPDGYVHGTAGPDKASACLIGLGLKPGRGADFWLEDAPGGASRVALKKGLKAQLQADGRLDKAVACL